MKRFIAISLLLLAPPSSALASDDGSITDYFHQADTIYLVRAKSISAGGPYRSEVKFVVTEVLRGKPTESLTLTPGIIHIKQDSEFLIVSSKERRGYQQANVVGSMAKGVVGWADAPVVRDNWQILVFGAKFNKNNAVWVYDKIIDGQPYLTLDHVKDLLKQDADKSPTK